MAQLRQDFAKFKAMNAEIVVVGPESPEAFKQYFTTHNLPFIGLADPKHTVLTRYGQEVNLFKLGRMPGQMLIDMQGTLRFVHYGHDMTDIPTNEEILGLLEEMQEPV